jgi:hypothetical protein
MVFMACRGGLRYQKLPAVATDCRPDYQHRCVGRSLSTPSPHERSRTGTVGTQRSILPRGTPRGS